MLFFYEFYGAVGGFAFLVRLLGHLFIGSGGLGLQDLALDADDACLLASVRVDFDVVVDYSTTESLQVAIQTVQIFLGLNLFFFYLLQLMLTFGTIVNHTGILCERLLLLLAINYLR